MKKQELYDTLIKPSFLEVRLKEYYERTGEFYPTDKISDLISEGDYAQWGINGRIRTQAINGCLEENPFELMESDYFANGDDIRILKNLSYTHVSEHQHTFFEMMFLLNGECTNIVDGSKINMKQGDICIIPPRVVHSIEVNSESVLFNILIKTSTFTDAFIPLLRYSNVLSDFFNEILYANTYKKYLLFHTENDEEIMDSFLDMYGEQQEKKNYYAEIMNGLLMVSCGKLLQKHEQDVEYPMEYVEEHNIIPKIIAYIEKNYNVVTLDKCAVHFHFNSQYLSALLKKHTGKPFSLILTEKRMVVAREQLLKTNSTLKEISIQLGYQNEDYFMKVFKKYYGCTPGEYRRK
ncbi:MAG: AraC family transcriptional regulator [Lachnospiraceae bacterium]|nr:AraC family transcriptional regulator [Lachnospiraceae bacterium]